MNDIFNNIVQTYSTEIIGGLIASLLWLLFGKISNFIKNIRIAKKYSGYIGDYYIYSFASSGEDRITTTKLSIKTKFRKLFVTANNGVVYNYTGEMYITDLNIYIMLDGLDHKEKVLIIFYSPLHREIKNLVGSINAVSVINEPFSSICILSDKDLPEEKIKEKLEKNGVDYKNSMFKVSKNYSIYFDNIENQPE